MRRKVFVLSVPKKPHSGIIWLQPMNSNKEAKEKYKLLQFLSNLKCVTVVHFKKKLIDCFFIVIIEINDSYRYRLYGGSKSI